MTPLDSSTFHRDMPYLPETEAKMNLLDRLPEDCFGIVCRYLAPIHNVSLLRANKSLQKKQPIAETQLKITVGEEIDRLFLCGKARKEADKLTKAMTLFHFPRTQKQIKGPL